MNAEIYDGIKRRQKYEGTYLWVSNEWKSPIVICVERRFFDLEDVDNTLKSIGVEFRRNKGNAGYDFYEFIDENSSTFFKIAAIPSS